MIRHHTQCSGLSPHTHTLFLYAAMDSLALMHIYIFVFVFGIVGNGISISLSVHTQTETLTIKLTCDVCASHKRNLQWLQSGNETQCQQVARHARMLGLVSGGGERERSCQVTSDCTVTAPQRRFRYMSTAGRDIKYCCCAVLELKPK